MMKTSVFSQKMSWRGEKQDDPTIYPPWIFFQMCWSNPEGSSKSLAYGILDNLPAPFNGETFRFPPALVKPNTEITMQRCAKPSNLENYIGSVSSYGVPS